MASVFVKMMAGEIPCERLAEDARFLAILEPRPLAAGHALVLPKREVDHFFDLEEEELAALLALARRVAAAIRAEFPCEKVAALSYGIQVRHAHLHLVPVTGRAGELDFANAREASTTELAETAARLRRRLEKT